MPYPFAMARRSRVRTPSLGLSRQMGWAWLSGMVTMNGKATKPALRIRTAAEDWAPSEATLPSVVAGGSLGGLRFQPGAPITIGGRPHAVADSS